MDFDDDKPHDECGVIAVMHPGPRSRAGGLLRPVRPATPRPGERRNRHQRRQTAYIYKDMGLVAQVFNEGNLAPLKGHLAIGHNRYSTTGSSTAPNASPYMIETMYGPMGVAHNGNLTNAAAAASASARRGVGLASTTRQRGDHPDAGRAAGDLGSISNQAMKQRSERRTKTGGWRVCSRSCKWPRAPIR